jgi:hypothetical protein
VADVESEVVELAALLAEAKLTFGVPVPRFCEFKRWTANSRSVELKFPRVGRGGGNRAVGDYGW